MRDLQPKNDDKLNKLVNNINDKVRALKKDELDPEKIKDTVAKMENYINYLNSKKTTSKSKSNCDCKSNTYDNSEINTLVKEIKNLTQNIKKLSEKLNYVDNHHNYDKNYNKYDKIFKSDKLKLKKIFSFFIKKRIFKKLLKTISFRICGQKALINS